MKNKIIFTVFFIFSACALIYGNGGSFTLGNLATGQLTLMKNQQISIEEEDLRITLFRGYARVDVIYIMKNHGDAVTARLGFPSLIHTKPVEPNYQQEIEDYSISIEPAEGSGYGSIQKIPAKYVYNNEQVKWMKMPDIMGDDYAPLEYPEIGWFISNIGFAGSQTIRVTISYISRYISFGWYVSDNTRTENSEFRYLFSFGSTWKGPIAKGRVTIDSSHIQHGINITPADRFVKNNSIYTWEFRDFEPKGKDNILITINNRYSDSYMYGSQEGQRFFSVNKKYYMSLKPGNVKTSSTLKQYSAKKLFDSDFKTAWVENNTNDGNGEFIEITFSKLQKINTIGIIPGYNKSRELFYKNNRVAEIEIYADDKLIKTAAIADGYTSLSPDDLYAYYLINLSENNISCKKIKLVITKIYKGSEYTDACVSELLLLQKLDKEPEVGGR